MFPNGCFSSTSNRTKYICRRSAVSPALSLRLSFMQQDWKLDVTECKWIVGADLNLTFEAFFSKLLLAGDRWDKRGRLHLIASLVLLVSGETEFVNRGFWPTSFSGSVSSHYPLGGPRGSHAQGAVRWETLETKLAFDRPGRPQIDTTHQSINVSLNFIRIFRPTECNLDTANPRIRPPSNN